MHTYTQIHVRVSADPCMHSKAQKQTLPLVLQSTDAMDLSHERCCNATAKRFFFKTVIIESTVLPSIANRNTIGVTVLTTKQSALGHELERNMAEGAQ